MVRFCTDETAQLAENSSEPCTHGDSAEAAQMKAPMTPLQPSRTCLYDTHELNAVLNRMAAQLMAMVHDAPQLAIIGILRRGAPLADLLTQRMVDLHGLKPPLRLDLAVKRYADDLTLLYPETQLNESTQHTGLDLKNHQLLLVDDVLYTGHSVQRVLTYLLQKNPARIWVACLADRRTARLPVHADVVGVQLAVAPADIIECHVPPYETDFKIELVKPVRTPPG
jgi:pyrimidine operon attenuation protein/uracil phosphoribosyltransferase